MIKWLWFGLSIYWFISSVIWFFKDDNLDRALLRIGLALACQAMAKLALIDEEN